MQGQKSYKKEVSLNFPSDYPKTDGGEFGPKTCHEQIDTNMAAVRQQ